MSQTTDNMLRVEPIVNDILSAIDREREREIIARRYGLFDRKETLEQIGELLGITRERVRQLEKSVMAKLTAMGKKDLPHISEVGAVLIEQLSQAGKIAKITDLSAKLTPKNSKIDQSRVAFIAKLAPSITFVNENDHFHNAAALASEFSEKSATDRVGHVVDAIKKIGKPVSIAEVAGAMGHPDAKEVEALASISKDLATLNGRWGLIKWPMVNPKNIRDKIYVILYENGKQMHFNEIAEAISGSDFKRKDVTTQAIHNELIKDKRFILVGRGIYALKEWGFKQGTVADVITEVLEQAGEPLHRDEIVKRVLKKRFVKETTILLNLQGKPQFKRTAKATYTLSDAKVADNKVKTNVKK
jgi:DNA-binding CsgD family transcriptional regulator